MAGMRLGVEKNLGMHHVVCRRAGQVGVGHVVKIGLGAQHQRARMVDVKKVLQVVKHIGAAQRFDIRVRHGQAVALRQRKHQLRLQRAFNMDVQFGLGHQAQQVWQAIRRDGFNDSHGQSSL